MRNSERQPTERDGARRRRTGRDAGRGNGVVTGALRSAPASDVREPGGAIIAAHIVFQVFIIYYGTLQELGTFQVDDVPSNGYAFEQMRLLPKAVLDLATHGIKGDIRAVRHLTKRLLRNNDTELDEIRDALTELLVHSEAQPTRLLGRFDNDVGLPAGVTATLVNDAPTPILAAAAWEQVQRIIREREHETELKALGLEPTRSVLFVGPPGVGKTLTAQYLAHRLGIPLVSIDLATVMSSLLGGTGNNLRSALEFAAAQPSVLFLDELDALAKRRDDVADVGEPRRIVNVLLLELDRWTSSSLFVAATNHPELLDRAIWRRFDAVVQLPNPEFDARARIIDAALLAGLQSVDRETIETVARATDGFSAAALVALCKSALRNIALGDATAVAEALGTALVEHMRRSALDDRSRAGIALAMHALLGTPHRSIAEEFGVSHATIGRDIRALTKRASGGRKYAQKK